MLPKLRYFVILLALKSLNMSEQVSCFKWGTSSSSINASSCSCFSGFNTTGNLEAALYDQVDNVAMNDTSAENFDALHNWVDNQLADLAKHDHNNNEDNVSQDVPELDSDDDHHDHSVDDFHEVIFLVFFNVL